MRETFTQGEITISLCLNPDHSVDKSKQMDIQYPVYGQMVEANGAWPQSAYNSRNPKQNVATIAHQFEFAKTLQRFDETYLRVTRKDQ